MIKKSKFTKFSKLISLLSLVAFSSTTNINTTFADITGTWKQENGLWKFYNTENKAVSSWVKISGKWYFFDTNNNSLKTSWYQDANGKWYFFDSTKGSNEGVMLKSWQWIDGYSYYFGENESNEGLLFVSTTTPDGYKVNSLGQWIDEQSNPVFIANKGILTKAQTSTSNTQTDNKKSNKSSTTSSVRSGGGGGGSRGGGGGGGSRGGGGSSSGGGSSRGGSSSATNNIAPKTELPTPTPTQPNVPTPTQPEVPVPTQPQTTAPTKPEVPAPTQPQSPAPTKPEVPVPTQPQTTAPTKPEVPAPTQPQTPTPTQPEVPEPTQPQTTAPTKPEVPVPTRPQTPAPTKPEVPAPTQPQTTAPTQPEMTKPTQPKIPQTHTVILKYMFNGVEKGREEFTVNHGEGVQDFHVPADETHKGVYEIQNGFSLDILKNITEDKEIEIPLTYTRVLRNLEIVVNYKFNDNIVSTENFIVKEDEDLDISKLNIPVIGANEEYCYKIDDTFDMDSLKHLEESKTIDIPLVLDKERASSSLFTPFLKLKDKLWTMTIIDFMNPQGDQFVNRIKEVKVDDVIFTEGDISEESKYKIKTDMGSQIFLSNKGLDNSQTHTVKISAQGYKSLVKELKTLMLPKNIDTKNNVMTVSYDKDVVGVRDYLDNATIKINNEIYTKGSKDIAKQYEIVEDSEYISLCISTLDFESDSDNIIEIVNPNHAPVVITNKVNN